MKNGRSKPNFVHIKERDPPRYKTVFSVYLVQNPHFLSLHVVISNRSLCPILLSSHLSLHFMLGRICTFHGSSESKSVWYIDPA
jgi:hypothetical protein